MHKTTVTSLPAGCKWKKAPEEPVRRGSCSPLPTAAAVATVQEGQQIVFLLAHTEGSLLPPLAVQLCK